MKSRGNVTSQPSKYRHAERVVMSRTGVRVRKLMPKEVAELQAHIDSLMCGARRKRITL